MKSELTPTLIKQVGDNYILWFKNSNQYIVVDQALLELVQLYLDVKNSSKFEVSLLQLEFDSKTIQSIEEDISLFLDSCNAIQNKQQIPDIEFNPNYRKFVTYYKIDKMLIEVNYQSEDIKNLIHPQLTHLSSSEKTMEVDHIFDVCSEEDELRLFKNETFIGSYPITDYHLLQGKFAMLLLCALTETVEEDWIGTFHASTVEKNNQAVMVIGDSGKGKSTFTALLLANGFNVMADDITSIRAKDCKVYKYPGGISIKAGAFSLLESIISDFEKLPSFYINPYKGYVKYVPSKSVNDFNKGVACNTMVCINYNENEQTTLESMPINEALEILIPESWLSPLQEHAELFLNWIKDVRVYKLTYSNHEDAILKFSELFES